MAMMITQIIGLLMSFVPEGSILAMAPLTRKKITTGLSSSQMIPNIFLMLFIISIEFLYSNKLALCRDGLLQEGGRAEAFNRLLLYQFYW